MATFATPLDAVRAGYEAFARGDVPAVLDLLDPQVEWTEAAGFPYPGTFVGPKTVLHCVFMKLGTEWEDWRAVPKQFVAQGEVVVALGEYRGRHRKAGRAFTASFAHVWTFRDGKVARFRQHTDTLLIRSAMEQTNPPRWPRRSRRSPYLRYDDRLADVLAAIQVMSSVTPESQPEQMWTNKLGDPPSAKRWLDLFLQHPEFFRVNDEDPPLISLRWRHGLDRTHPYSGPPAASGKEGLCRPPLEPSQIETLLMTAVEMHDRALAVEAERRWLYPSLFALGGVVLGSVLQALLR